MSSDSGRFGWHGACQVHTEARNGYGQGRARAGLAGAAADVRALLRQTVVAGEFRSAWYRSVRAMYLLAAAFLLLVER